MNLVGLIIAIIRTFQRAQTSRKKKVETTVRNEAHMKAIIVYTIEGMELHQRAYFPDEGKPCPYQKPSDVIRVGAADDTCEFWLVDIHKNPYRDRVLEYVKRSANMFMTDRGADAPFEESRVSFDSAEFEKLEPGHTAIHLENLPDVLP